MSKNPGNSGQTWILSKLVSVQVQGDKVVCHLECGHSYASSTSYGTPEASAARIRLRIGKRQGCRECKSAVQS